MNQGSEEGVARTAGRGIAGVLRGPLVVLGAVVGILSYVGGQLPVLLLGVMAAGASWGSLDRFVALVRGRLARGVWRGRGDREDRLRRYQAMNWLAFWLAAGFTVVATLPEDLLSPGDLREFRAVATGLTGLNALLAVVPVRRRVRLVWNVLPLVGWLFLVEEWVRIVAGPPEPVVELAAPFDGEWGVGQGGRSALVNHHYVIRAQSHALDVVKRGQRPGDLNAPGVKLEDFASFGAELKAPGDGLVVRADHTHRDNPIGQTDTEDLEGNHVVIDLGGGRYVLMAHLKQWSLRVSKGQRVRAGEVVGACGNSGNTSEPHLHLQVQSRPSYWARGSRTYPIRFRDAKLLRGGDEVAGSPRRNDRIVSGVTHDGSR